jgi:hypothetical protein
VREAIEECRSGTQEPTAASADHTAHGATVHKPQRFDWAREVDCSLGLSTTDSDPSDAIPNAPALANSDCTLPVPTNCTPAAYTPTASALDETGDVATQPMLADRGPVYSVRASTVPVDPDPVVPDLADTVPIAFAKRDPIRSSQLHTPKRDPSERSHCTREQHLHPPSPVHHPCRARRYRAIGHDEQLGMVLKKART